MISENKNDDTMMHHNTWMDNEGTKDNTRKIKEPNLQQKHNKKDVAGSVAEPFPKYGKRKKSGKHQKTEMKTDSRWLLQECEDTQVFAAASGWLWALYHEIWRKSTNFWHMTTQPLKASSHSLVLWWVWI